MFTHSFVLQVYFRVLFKEIKRYSDNMINIDSFWYFHFLLFRLKKQFKVQEQKINPLLLT